MRIYIRHPIDITIYYSLCTDASSTASNGHDQTRLKNISQGGLCFKSENPVDKNSKIHIRIPIGSPAFEAEGFVTWCRKNKQFGYEIGVRFSDSAIEFSLRMVEQACYIKHYMYAEEKQGRTLSCDQAAEEWIHKYAAQFPR